jgi:hypothetical protein
MPCRSGSPHAVLGAGPALTAVCPWTVPPVSLKSPATAPTSARTTSTTSSLRPMWTSRVSSGVVPLGVREVKSKNRETWLWTLDFGLWALGSGRWALGVGLWALGSGLWALGVGLWPDTGVAAARDAATRVAGRRVAPNGATRDKAESQAPRAESQEPRAKSREPFEASGV